MNPATAALTDRQASFQAQLDAHKGIVFKVVSTFAWQAEDQLDLAQDIILQLWRAFPKYDSSRSFATWMYQVALNTAISWSRKAKLRSRRMVEAENLDDIPAAILEPNDSEALYRLLETLDELNRALLMLYIEERSHAEIGQILGISPANVATKISRLKVQLRLEAAQQNEN